MKLSLCNEVLREMTFPEQCAYAAALGYDALEVAPFTLGDDPHLMGPGDRARLREEARAAGVEISGLHWLLLAPAGLTLNGPDKRARDRTVEVMRRLIDLCADLGGGYMVHGSPAQRSVAPDDDPGAARERAIASFQAVAGTAEAAGVVYCVEPLARTETNFINTVAEAVALVEDIGSPAFKTMIDTRAATASEAEPVEDLLRRWVPSGLIGHVQVNDTNRRGPGQGEVRFAGILAALAGTGYDGVVAVEPFAYHPDGPACAARAVGYLRGLLEALEG